MNEAEVKEYSSSDIKNNNIRAVIAYTANVVATMLASGTLVQTFLGLLGYESSLIYLYSTLLQAANVITIMLAASWAEHGNIIKRAAAVYLPSAAAFLLHVPFAIAKNASIEAYVMILGLGIVQKIALGLHTVCEYKLPYYVYRPNDYGRVLGICGIVSSLASLGVSSLVTMMVAHFSYFDVMLIAFSVAAVLLVIASLVTRLQKNIMDTKEPGVQARKNEKTVSILTVFRYPVFSFLIPANLLRGFSSGVVTVLATVALDLGFDETLTTAMVTASTFSSLVACTAFTALTKRIPPRISMLVGSLVTGIMPLLLIKNGTVFLAVYTVILFGRTLVDYGVPAMLRLMVPVDIAGPYHAWRMVLQHAGSLLATAIASFIPIPWLLSLAALTQIVSGISFYLVRKRAREVV